MPRKQRFKPSRKPKPVEQQQETTAQPMNNPRDVRPEQEQTRPYGTDIESGRSVRSQGDSGSGVESTGNTDDRA